MATISLYASKINNMPSLIKDFKSSVKDLKSELTLFKNQCQSVNKNICNLDDVISSISTSTQTQEQKVTVLDSFSKNVEQFASDVDRIDSNVADIVNQNKDDFYDKYHYLKPDCEKGWLEKGWDDFKSGCSKAWEWCKEHWKLVVTIVLVIVAIVAIVLTAGAALGPLAAALIMACKGIIIGAAIGGLAGGTISALTGGSFLEGFEDGAFSGAISGAITGGMGSWMSGAGKVTLSLGKVILIGATAETGASLLGDIGDKYIKGENISWGEVAFNAGFSAILGGVFAAGGYGLAKKLPVLIKGLTKGNGSWAHVWTSQSTRSLKHGTKVSLKTILKGIGSEAIKDAWDFVLEPFKNLVDKWKGSWNFIPQH